jgi:hypothetical protein
MVPKHLGPLSQVLAREALLRGATQSVPSDWSSKREPSHIRQRYSGPVRLERIPAIPQKDVRISLDVPAPVVGGGLFVAALPASSRLCARNTDRRCIVGRLSAANPPSKKAPRNARRGQLQAQASCAPTLMHAFG